jgi:TetR/AcrR family transcriptional regulator, regulator of autoinduction and epiphytic fitness
MTSQKTPKISFKAQMLAARERAIIDAVNRLLAEKGFEFMTVDEVAAEVGIAKASLYKHFPSKEDLAAAAMGDLMHQALQELSAVPADWAPLRKLRHGVEWTLRLKLSGRMPTLPSQNSSLRTALAAHKAYMDGLIQVSDLLGGWIEAAQARQEINPKLPAIAVLYTLYARACDPVLEFLRMAELHSDEEIVDMVMVTCFEGLQAR